MFGVKTKYFFDSAAGVEPPPAPSTDLPLLEVRGIRKVFSSGGLFAPRRRLVAVEDVSFSVHRGEAVALVGESGSGKSTLARIVLRLDPPDSGSILIDGKPVLAHEPRSASLAYRGRVQMVFRSRVQMVFQDPFSSLNPVHTVAHHLSRPLLRHRKAHPRDVRARSIELLRLVGLEPAEDFMDRLPNELSGGQRQRVAIARALAVEPDLLVADEPTSMLDVSIRTGILNLFSQLKRDHGLAILLITHDLASARYLCDRILVLFRGRVVEAGPSADVVSAPAHPYTRALVASIADAGHLQSQGGKRPHADPITTAGGCPFASRCPSVMDVCRSVDPAPRSVKGRLVRCHLYPESAQVGAE